MKNINEYVQKNDIWFIIYTQTITVAVSLIVENFTQHICVYSGNFIKPNE